MKKTNFNLLLLNGVFVTGLLVSNLFGSKLISLIGFTLPGAVITYPLTFLVTDVIGELWGKQEANQCVRVGFISQLVILGISYTSLLIPALPSSAGLQESLFLIINQGFRMTVASLAAFVCSQTVDVHIFHRIKEKHGSKRKWVRNNLSTMTSQLVDTLIFITVAFFGVVPNLFSMVVGQYCVKLILAALDTPFFYLLTRNKEIRY